MKHDFNKIAFAHVVGTDKDVLASAVAARPQVRLGVRVASWRAKLKLLEMTMDVPSDLAVGFDETVCRELQAYSTLLMNPGAKASKYGPS